MLSKTPINSVILFLAAIVLFSCGGSGEKSAVTEKKKTDKPKADTSKPVSKKEEPFDIFHFLLDEEAKGIQKKKINYNNHSISFTNEDDPYTVSFSMLSAEDLNRDGVTDYIIYRTSEGMLGGNANTNSAILYFIMGSDNKIGQRHEILTYAPFSYNILEDISYKNGKLKAVATQNFRSYFPEEGKELQSTNLSFVYSNGNVYEESYLTDCELAVWKNKQLFKGNSEVTRTIEMHNYTESILEKYKSGEFEVSAEFSGCDNLSLVLETTFPFRGNQKELKEKRNDFLEFLKKHTTRLSDEFGIIQQCYLENEPTNKGEELANLSFGFYTTQKKGKMTFRLRIDKIRNPSQTENWEITTRH